MSEENISGAVTEAAAPLSNVSQEAQPEQQQKEDQMVPLSALQSERALRQQKEQEANFYKENLDLFRANMQQQFQQNQKQPEKDGFGELSENDVLTVGEAKKALTNLDRQYRLSIEELRMTQRYPDYQEVITKFLPEVLKTNPKLRTTIEETSDFELAYYLAKNSDQYRAENKKKQIHADAERIVQNSQKAGSLSSVGSASVISHAKRYKDMSDTDFMKEVHRNLGYA
jgi:hypothetical protein